MPLLPDQVLRILEGLLSVVCLGGTFVSPFLIAWAGIYERFELVGIQVTLERALIAMLVFPLGTLWFAFNAIRGGRHRTQG